MRIKLTAPNGMKIEIEASNIEGLFPNDGAYTAAVKTIVEMEGDDVKHGVVETIAQIDAMRDAK